MTGHANTLKRARELKASTDRHRNAIDPPSAPSEIRRGTSEDTLIITLRAEGISWADIVTSLNERRLADEETPSWTEAAAYSRFILNNSPTAAPAKEIGFEPQDYAHLKNANSGGESLNKAGRKRVKDFQNATELSANIRKPATIEDLDGKKIKEKSETHNSYKGKSRAKARGKKTDEQRRKGESEGEVVKMNEGMLEMLMHAVAKVERNFWVFVADEVERESGKFVDAKELEKVFHAI